MAITESGAIVRYLRRFLSDQREADTDGYLLTRFIEHRDESAFDALVRRHGSMVLGVCHRILGNEHDAEDAFQATFLVLVRKAASVVPRDYVGNWLYGVAHNIALKARAAGVKRRVREQQMTHIPEPGSMRRYRDPWEDMKPLLDQELSRLPDKYRVPIVLCDLEGNTHNEAARLLSWPVGTLSGRLSRARTLLAKRLARHGLSLSAGLLAAALSQNAAPASLSNALSSSTVKVAMLCAAGHVTITTIVSPRVDALVKGVLKAMLLSNLKIATAFLAVTVIGVGSGILAYRPQVAETLVGDQGLEKQETRANADSDSKSDDSRILRLQKERLAVLKEIAAEKKDVYMRGQLAPDELSRADLAVLRAELELCESDNARLLIHEKIVASMKGQEEYFSHRYNAGRLVHSDLLTAKVNRSEAEIDLARAKAKAVPKVK